jgi:PPK2 family polyphosphate:nucleotide phosphotransferase
MGQLDTLSTIGEKLMSKEALLEKTDLLAREIGVIQNLLKADSRYAVLIVLQGMDASGKDGTTEAITRYCHPSGLVYKAFKAPTKEELAHDFLWRVHPHVPARGQMAIFNRSHYEDVLVQRVNAWVSEERIEARFNAINAFEKMLWLDNYTLVIKIFLHISYERQYEKLLERVNELEKNWKHNDGDWQERTQWAEYMAAYEDVFARCTTPWHIVPADSESRRDFAAVQAVHKALSQLPLAFPPLSPEQIRTFNAISR